MAAYEVTSWQIQKYSHDQHGGYYAFHHEVSSRSSMHRVMSYILYLNDIDEGGETEFLHQGIRIKPEVGKLVFFPAYFTHTHRGNPVLSKQDKYIMTGWMEFI
jgi:Rps23 Pro-64 3,4-dihydroxylase Tpa1-like proline 4-hydroxylase